MKQSLAAKASRYLFDGVDEFTESIGHHDVHSKGIMKQSLAAKASRYLFDGVDEFTESIGHPDVHSFLYIVAILLYT